MSSSNVSYKVTEDRVSPALRQLVQRMGGRSAHELIGTAILRVIQDHFQERDQSPNKNRFPNRSHFWSKLALGSHFRATDSEAVVSLPYPFAQKFYGGTIRPGPGKKFLAIPVAPIAYGRLPRAFKNLKVLRTANGSKSQAVLVAVGDGAKRLKKGQQPAGTPLFVLVRKVTQQPDAAALPTESAILDAAYQELNDNAPLILEAI
jgi:hypothetical protein